MGLVQPIIVATTGQIEDSYVTTVLNDGINLVLGKPIKYDNIKEILIKLGYTEKGTFF